jgi:cell division septal protein FtsQ
MRFFEAKSYGLHETSNPLFPRKENPRRRRPWIVALAVTTLAITAGAGVVYGPYLSLETVEVTGTVTLNAEDISNKVQEQFELKRFLILPNSHQWFFDAGSAEVMLLKFFPLKSASIQKDGPTLRVDIVEDIFMVAMRSGDDVYLLDPTGKVIRAAEPAEQTAVLVKVGATGPSESGMAVIHQDMPVLREKTAVAHNPDDQIFTAAIIENVIQFSEGLRAIGINPVEFVSDDASLPWFTVTSDRPYLILFDATQDVDTQLAVLKTVLDERFTTDELPRYIDVRFGNRVYVR